MVFIGSWSMSVTSPLLDIQTGDFELHDEFVGIKGCSTPCRSDHVK